jgi:hypothetical protein
VEFIRNHFGNDLICTPASKLLYETKFSVDKTHFKGHVGKWCRENMNPYKNKSEFLQILITHVYGSNLTSARWNKYTSCRATFLLGEGLRQYSQYSWLAQNADLSLTIIPLQKP